MAPHALASITACSLTPVPASVPLCSSPGMTTPCKVMGWPSAWMIWLPKVVSGPATEGATAGVVREERPGDSTKKSCPTAGAQETTPKMTDAVVAGAIASTSGRGPRYLRQA